MFLAQTMLHKEANQSLAKRHPDAGRQGEAYKHHPTAEARRHRKTSRRHDPGASVTASGIRPQRLGDKRETRPRSQRHSIWHPTAETGRQAGDTTLEPASQHLASDRIDWEKSRLGEAADRRDWETQGDTTPEPASQKTGDGRHRETSGRHNPAASVTASGIQTQGDKRETRPEPASSGI